MMMRPLSPLQQTLQLIGGVMMIAGAGCFAIVLWNDEVRAVASWVFLIGAVLFTVIQAMQVYEGNSIVVRRLRRIQALGGLLFIVAGFLMVDRMYALLRPLFSNDIDYLNNVGNKWVLALLIAAVLHLYTELRLGQELKKEDAKRQNDDS